jgi:hypothetical protein
MAEQGSRRYPIEEALRAKKALRDKAGLPPELFPVGAFVGMISDEIESLRQRGHSDQDIAETISAHSKIEITAAEIAEHYAGPEQRHPGEQHQRGE